MTQPSGQAQESKSLYSFTRSTILDLPQEIVLMILLHAVLEDGEISCQERTRVQLVCRALHDFVNFTPSFWNHLSVSQPKELWQRHIDKSSQLGLKVACDLFPEHELHASFLSTILPHAHRIHSLSCNVGPECQTVITEAITRAVLNLRDLKLFSTTGFALYMDGIPFDGMPRLERIDFSDLTLNPTTWCKATGLRVVNLEETDWVDKISTFLDFLKQNDQLEEFHYSFKPNVHSTDTLGPQIIPFSYDTIVLPNLTHLTLYSIPAFHLLTVLQHASFPPHSYINATLADSFPPDEHMDFVAPAMALLVALRPPSSLELMFDGEEAYVTATEQRWNLGFYNNALDIEPREEAYPALLQQIPPRIRVLISSVRIVKTYSEDVEFLVKAVSENIIHLTKFESPLNQTMLAALWLDKSRGWDGFRLPKLQSITFHIWKYSTADDIHTLRDLLQAYSATMQGSMRGLETKIVVPMHYDQGDIQVALEDPILLNLGPLVERVAKDEVATDDESEFDGTFEVDEEDIHSDDEENEEDTELDDEEDAGADDLEDDETTL